MREKSVPGNTFSSACNTRDCLAKNFKKIGAVGESGKSIPPGRLDRKDRSLVFQEKFFCDGNAEHDIVG